MHNQIMRSGRIKKNETHNFSASSKTEKKGSSLFFLLRCANVFLFQSLPAEIDISIFYIFKMKFVIFSVGSSLSLRKGNKKINK